MKKKIAFRTLGCKLNQYEADAIAAQFLEAGYEVVEDQDGADATIINTCTVTVKSDRKSRNTINHVRHSNPEQILVVTGCYAESSREVLEEQEGITYLVDNKRKTNIFSLVDSHFRGEIQNPKTLKPDLFAYPAAESPFHTRGLVKIQDGCDNFCSFCIIPSVRGPGTSREPEQILQDIRALVQFNIKEIVLTGVNVSRYESHGLNFENLLEKILAQEGDFRLRVASLEPECLGKKFLDLLTHPKMAPHLHLCLQSGNDRILQLMKRQYTIEQYLSLANAVKGKVPHINLTTDLIVGFPGETDKEFQDSLDVCEKIAFGQVHVFKFSSRPDTPAASLPQAVPEKVKTLRAEKAATLAKDLQIKYQKSLKGRLERILIEKNLQNAGRGLSGTYVSVHIPQGPYPWNTFVDVTLGDPLPDEDLTILGIIQPKLNI